LRNGFAYFYFKVAQMTVAQLPTFQMIDTALFSNNFSQRLLEQSADFI